MDREATVEFLRALLGMLHSCYGCKADPEDILVGSRPERESPRENVTADTVSVVVIGASNAKKLAVELKKRGYNVIDLTVPGWLPTQKNIGEVEQEIKRLGNVSSHSVVFEVLSNSAFRYENFDGTLGMALKADGVFHMGGKVTTCSKDSVNGTLKNVHHIFDLFGGVKICLPPLPRYLYDACCENPVHCEGLGTSEYREELLNKTMQLRRQLKEYFVKRSPGEVWVPNVVLDMVPECKEVASMAGALKKYLARDGVHLTAAGYGALADCTKEVLQTKSAASISVSGSGKGQPGEKPFFWRGFKSPVGTNRRKSHQWPQAAKGGGKWRQEKRSSGQRGGMGRGGLRFPRIAGYRGRY
jgi:hypothetical protein